MKLRSVYLENFRSYKKLRIKVDNIKFIILTGKNGIGKTNLLEAISFLSPGKGFKNCKLEEVFNNQKKLKQCSIFSVIENKNEKNEIGIGFSNKILNNKIFTKKVIQVNGKTPKASTRLKKGDVINVILPPPPSKDILAEEIPLEVIFEDRDIIVIGSCRFTQHSSRLQSFGIVKEFLNDFRRWLDIV